MTDKNASNQSGGSLGADPALLERYRRYKNGELGVARTRSEILASGYAKLRLAARGSDT